MVEVVQPRPTNMVWSVVAAVLLLVAGAVAALFAGREGASFMFDLEQTEPALARVAVEPEPVPAPALSRRVVIAIVDGLRYDVDEQGEEAWLDRLPFLGSLRDRGLATVASSQYPTFSKPNYVNILTGVPPAASGVRTNRYPAAVQLDSLMDRVRAATPPLPAGYASDYDAMPKLFLRGDIDDVNQLETPDEITSAAADEALMSNFPSDFDDARYAPWPGGFRDSARLLLARHDRGLVVLLVGVVDAAGHEFGGDSEEYAHAAENADATLAAVLGDVDLTRDTAASRRRWCGCRW
jgi:hypothetical protein